MSDLYTVISATNRLTSNTFKVAVQYEQLLKNLNVDVQLFSLEGWKWFERDAEFEKIESEILVPTTKFVFIVPEYNGSIPGVLKMMFDISLYKDTWYSKKALLTGIAKGRAGNLRGVEHLTGILHYLHVFVHPNTLPISSVDKLINEAGLIEDKKTLQAINLQLEEFIRF